MHAPEREKAGTRLASAIAKRGHTMKEAFHARAAESDARARAPTRPTRAATPRTA
jgi:hypothetical protein